MPKRKFVRGITHTKVVVERDRLLNHSQELYLELTRLAKELRLRDVEIKRLRAEGEKLHTLAGHGRRCMLKEMTRKCPYL